jgi:hypothetical protein
MNLTDELELIHALLGIGRRAGSTPDRSWNFVPEFEILRRSVKTSPYLPTPIIWLSDFADESQGREIGN